MVMEGDTFDEAIARDKELKEWKARAEKAEEKLKKTADELERIADMIDINVYDMYIHNRAVELRKLADEVRDAE